MARTCWYRNTTNAALSAYSSSSSAVDDIIGIVISITGCGGNHLACHLCNIVYYLPLCMYYFRPAALLSYQHRALVRMLSSRIMSTRARVGMATRRLRRGPCRLFQMAAKMKLLISIVYFTVPVHSPSGRRHRAPSPIFLRPAAALAHPLLMRREGISAAHDSLTIYRGRGWKRREVVTRR